MICGVAGALYVTSGSASLFGPSSLAVDCKPYSSRLGVLVSRLKPSVAFHGSQAPLFCSFRGSETLSWTVPRVSGSTRTVNLGKGPGSNQVGECDLLVVGPGVLGTLVAELWLKGTEGSNVVGQTNTVARHELLRSLGILPVVKDLQNDVKFPYVIFCAPPSGSSDYPSEVRAAVEKWDGKGSLLFTSSSALYDVHDNGLCDEQSAPCVRRGMGSRTDKLLDAEDEVLEVGGNVIRLAGLYTLNRGAHTFYLSKGSVGARPDHLLNLIHYEDAASLCMAILKGESRRQIYMGCDNVPVSRQEMMDAVNRSGKYEQKFNEFTSTDGPLGKRMNNTMTRLATGWKPKYESFVHFVRT